MPRPLFDHLTSAAERSKKQAAEGSLMHPSLAPHLHSEKCRVIIRQLEQCHKDHPLRKFLGACNPLKRALDECLKEELAQRRRENYAIAQEKKRKYRQLAKEDEDV